jgi:hypothetical protein
MKKGEKGVKWGGVKTERGENKEGQKWKGVKTEGQKRKG